MEPSLLTGESFEAEGIIIEARESFFSWVNGKGIRMEEDRDGGEEGFTAVSGFEHGLKVGIEVALFALARIAQVEGGLRDAVVNLPYFAVVGESHTGMKLRGEMIKEMLTTATDKGFDALYPCAELHEHPQGGAEEANEIVLVTAFPTFLKVNPITFLFGWAIWPSYRLGSYDCAVATKPFIDALLGNSKLFGGAVVSVAQKTQAFKASEVWLGSVRSTLEALGTQFDSGRLFLAGKSEVL